MSTEQSIDWPMCLEKAMHNADLAEELLQKIVNSLPQELDAMQSALQNKDYKQLEHLVHKLNGACLYSGLPQVHAGGKALETVLKADEIDALDSSYATFKAAIESVIDAHQQQSYK